MVTRRMCVFILSACCETARPDSPPPSPADVCTRAHPQPPTPTHSARVSTHPTPTHSARVFTHPHPHLFYKGLHTYTPLLILKGLYRGPPGIYSGSQPVFFTSTASLLSSVQKGPCLQSGQKVAGVEQRRTHPVVPGQQALALSSCQFLDVLSAQLICLGCR